MVHIGHMVVGAPLANGGGTWAPRACRDVRQQEGLSRIGRRLVERDVQPEALADRRIDSRDSVNQPLLLRHLQTVFHRGWARRHRVLYV